MKTTNVIIQDHTLLVKEYEGQRVVTFADIDRVHNRPNGTAGRNFRANKEKLIAGIDFMEVTKSDVPTKFVATYGFDKKAPKGILITESGYLMIVKSLTDDLSWAVQRELVNSYFRGKSAGGGTRNTSSVSWKLAS